VSATDPPHRPSPWAPASSGFKSKGTTTKGETPVGRPQSGTARAVFEREKYANRAARPKVTQGAETFGPVAGQCGGARRAAIYASLRHPAGIQGSKREARVRRPRSQKAKAHWPRSAPAAQILGTGGISCHPAWCGTDAESGRNKRGSNTSDACDHRRGRAKKFQGSGRWAPGRDCVHRERNPGQQVRATRQQAGRGARPWRGV